MAMPVTREEYEMKISNGAEIIMKAAGDPAFVTDGVLDIWLLAMSCAELLGSSFTLLSPAQAQTVTVAMINRLNATYSMAMTPKPGDMN